MVQLCFSKNRNAVFQQYSNRTKWLLLIPFTLISILIVSNPFTGFLFSVNDENLYVRGSGVLLHWICNWFYFIYASVFLLLKMRKESNRIRRREMLPLLQFVIAPAVASIF